MGGFYWERHPDGLFATLIRIATTYLHPEAGDLESLQRLARREGDEEMMVFKAELRAAVNDPGQVPGDELSRHVNYEDGSPVVAIVLGVLVLNEAITATTLGGIALVLAGIAMTCRQSESTSESPDLGPHRYSVGSVACR